MYLLYQEHKRVPATYPHHRSHELFRFSLQRTSPPMVYSHSWAWEQSRKFRSYKRFGLGYICQWEVKCNTTAGRVASSAAISPRSLITASCLKGAQVHRHCEVQSAKHSKAGDTLSSRHVSSCDVNACSWDVRGDLTLNSMAQIHTSVTLLTSRDLAWGSGRLTCQHASQISAVAHIS